MNAPAKSWVFTLNNWTESQYNAILDMKKTYLVVGQEVGDSGTPHLQGYIVFARAYRLSQLTKLLPKAHWEIAKCADAGNYCMKENYIIQDFRKKKVGDLNIVCKLPTLEILETNPMVYIRYHSGIEKMQQLLQEPRNFKPEVTWIYGPTGTGKTRSVVEKEPDLWISGEDLKFWNGYENQEAVLFDDFRADFCKFHTLLRILDRYPYSVNVKGGHRKFNSKRIYITSCYHPSEVYNTREDIEQLLRRIDVVTTVTGNRNSLGNTIENCLWGVEEDPAAP